MGMKYSLLPKFELARKASADPQRRFLTWLIHFKGRAAFKIA